MQYCSKCKVSIETPHKRCPLCQGKLEGEDEEESKLFPDLSGEKSRVFLGFKVFTFCCIAILVLGLAVNLMFPAPVFWAGFLAAAVVCMWILTAAAFIKRRNLLKNTLWQMVLLCVVFLFWDFLTGYRGWSLEYGIPVVILLVFPVLTVIVKLMKLPASYYMIYYLLACAAGLLQLLFWPAGLVQMHRVCVLCGAVSALVFAGLGIFQGKYVWEEMRKKTHM